MSNPSPQPPKIKVQIIGSDSVMIICITIGLILGVGDPSLLDAIIKLVLHYAESPTP